MHNLLTDNKNNITLNPLRYFTWEFPFSDTLYFYSIIYLRQLQYFLLHYIYLTAIVMNYFVNIEW